MTVNPVAVIRYQYDNHLGSASLELDENADVISYEEYHPFGTTSYRSGRSETETSQKRYKYVGKERDEETGLYYYGFRYYAAWICRFVSVDPLQFEYPHYTPFQYAGNKPISYIDLDGLEEAEPDDKNKNSISNWFWNDTKTGRGLTNIYKLFTGELKFSNGYEDLPQYTSEKQDDGSYAVHNNQASFFGIPYRATTTAATEADIPNEIERLKSYEIAVFGFEALGIAEGSALSIGTGVPKRTPQKSNLIPTKNSSLQQIQKTPLINAKTWQQYEKGISEIYGETSLKTRQYKALVDGKMVNGVADNVTEIAGRKVAVEAKFVKDWSKSIRNPKSPIGSKSFAIAEQEKMVTQAKKYTSAFDDVIYHTNSPELISHYTKIFNKNNITNFKFILTK